MSRYSYNVSCSQHAFLEYYVAIQRRLASMDNCISFLGLLVELKPLQTGHLHLGIKKFVEKNGG